MRLRHLTLFLLIAMALSSCSNPSADDKAAEPAGEKSAVAPLPPSTPASDKPAPSPAPPVAKKAPITIPANTDIHIVLSEALSSGKNKAGDEFKATLAQAVMVDGKTVLDKGTEIHGKVIDAEGSGRVKGRANMRLALTGVMVNDKLVPMTTVSLSKEAESTTGRDAGVVGGAAGVGAVIGAIAGGKKGAATGAVIGGGAGTGTVLATKGKEVEYGVESKLDFKLDKDLTVTP